MSTGVRFRRQKKITNWRAYNEGLKRRYDVTVWLDASVLEAPKGTEGGRGRPRRYSDGLLEMVHCLRCLYGLPLRGAEGFARGLFRLLGWDAHLVPDYTTLCRRCDGLALRRKTAKRGHRIHVVVDSTGLKVFGEGEWKVRQHGASKRRTWRKLHVGVDEQTGEIIADDLTENCVGDQEHLPVVLAQLDDALTPLRQVSADGIYDTYDCYEAAAAKGARLVCPPRKNAVLPRDACAPLHPRHDAIRECHEKGRKRWKKESGYHRRSLAETTMFRFKNSFGGHLRARVLPQQKAEAKIKVSILNRFTKLAKPAYA